MAFRAIGQANLNPARFAAIHVPVPPPAEQDAIVRFLEPQCEMMTTTEAGIETSIEKLIEYRAAIVTAAVTGKISALLDG